MQIRSAFAQTGAQEISQTASKGWKTARSFEAQFLKSMLEQAFAGVSGEGPLGGAGIGADAWRSFLIDEHAKAIAGRGGIGLASQVYRQMQARTQEAVDASA